MTAFTLETSSTGLLTLPDELLIHVLAYLPSFDTARATRVCRRLKDVAHDDHLWHRHLQNILPTKITTAFPAANYKDLYMAHQPYWFIPQHKIWFADDNPHGKIIISRYDQRRGCIEAHTLIADEGEQQMLHARWLDGTWVTVASFSPIVMLDKDRPVVSIPLAPKRDVSATPGKNRALEIELLMNNANDVVNGMTDRPSTALMLARPLPLERCTPQTALWPPLILPSLNNERVHNESNSGFKAKGFRPSKHTEKSESTFRIRQWVEFSRFAPIANILPGASRVAERVMTYATLPPEAYTPTKEKPWQGLWAGDFSGHGCEVILVTQPDDPAPLPKKARRAWRLWPRSGIRYRAGSLVPVQADESDYYDSSDDESSASASGSASAGSHSDATGPRSDGSADAWTDGTSTGTSTSNDLDEVVETNLDAAIDFLENNRMRRSQNESADTAVREARRRALKPDAVPFRGRIEGIKLTGDPNVRRGEYTFIAPDIGESGLVGHLQDPTFFDEDAKKFAAEYGEGLKGARVVKSIGHIADTGYVNDCYIPSQLVLLSGGRLAQYWECWGHLAFFQRIDLDALSKM